MTSPARPRNCRRRSGASATTWSCCRTCWSIAWTRGARSPTRPASSPTGASSSSRRRTTRPGDWGCAGVLWPWLDVPRHRAPPRAGRSRRLRWCGLSVRRRIHRLHAPVPPGLDPPERRTRDAFSAGGGDASGLPGRHRGSSARLLLLSTAGGPIGSNAIRSASSPGAPPPGPRGTPMIFTETPLKGAYLIDLEKRGDDRGFFAGLSASGSSPSTAW